jgi:predicted metal-dependent peptidase
VDPAWRLYIDPERLLAWSVPQGGSVLVHEVLHLLRDHARRSRDLGLAPDRTEAWNAACDAEINDDLVAAKLPLPGNPILPVTLGAQDGRLAEEYLRRVGKQRRRSVDCGSGVDGRPRPGDLALDQPGDDGVGAAQGHLIRRQVAAEIRSSRAKDPGCVPAGMVRWADEVLRPKVDWRRELRSLIRQGAAQIAGCVDYTFTRRNRRAGAVPGVILPGLLQPVPEVAVVVDTSASMNSGDLAQCLAEVDGIIASLNLRSRRPHLLAVDAKVHTTTRVTNGSKAKLEGGGGTDIVVGIAAATKLKPRPQLIVVLTDGYTLWPDSPPKGTRVVVAVIAGPGQSHPPGPSWARMVRVEVAR